MRTVRPKGPFGAGLFLVAGVDLEREIPEAMKPRAIPIASSGKILQVKPTKVAA